MAQLEAGSDKAVLRFMSRLAGTRRMGCLRRTVVAELGEMIHARAWGIYELDGTGKPSNVECTANVPDWFLDEYETGGRSTDPIYAGVLSVRGPVDSGRLLHWRRWRSEPVYEILDRVGYQRSLQAPLVVDGVVRGTLNIARHRDDPAFTPTDLVRMRTASVIVGRVFERVADDQLSRSAHALASIALDSIADPLIVSGEQGEALVVNDAAQKVLGTLKQDLLPLCMSAIRENLVALRRADTRYVSQVIDAAGERITVRTMWAGSDDERVAVSRIYRRSASVGAPPLDHSPLTSRQREIAAMAGAGMTVGQIAQKAFVSPNTVKQHLKRIYDALEVHSRAELVQVLWESSNSSMDVDDCAFV